MHNDPGENSVTEELECALRITKERLSNQMLNNVFLREERDKLLEANTSKNRFLATLAHEIRTPLTAINGFSEVLNDEILGELNVAQKDACNTIIHSGNYILNLINEILDISKIESGKIHLNFETMSLDPLIDDVILLVSNQVKEKNLQLKITRSDIKEEIAVDSIKIKEVLLNFLSNAIKFTNSGNKIGIDINFDKDTNNYIIRIWDQGIGISEENMKRLFNPFERIENLQEKSIPGTGLGLYYSKLLLQMHDSKVWVKSTLGKGSDFYFTIPTKTKYLQKFWRNQGVLLIGLDRVGKTTITNYFVNQQQEDNYRPTFGISISKVKKNNRSMRIHDTPGQKRLSDSWKKCIKDVRTVIFVIDISNKMRFDDATNLIDEYKENFYQNDHQVVILLHKIDLQDSIDNLRFAMLKFQKYSDSIPGLRIMQTSIFKLQTMQSLEEILINYIEKMN